MKTLTKKLLIVTTLIAMLLASGCSSSKENTTGLPDGFEILSDEDINNAISDYKDNITLGDCSKLTYHLDNDYTITDDKIKNGLITALPKIAIKTEIKDRAAQIGDTVNISYKGTIDGKTYSGSETNEKGETIILGFANYIDDFENKIVGMKTGETRTIDITYPSNYGSDTISGKTAKFEVTMNSIHTYDLPELTDDLIKANSDYKTVDEIKKACKEALEKQAAENKKIEIYNDVVKQIMDKSTYNEYPKEELDFIIDHTNKAISEYCTKYNVDKMTVLKDAYNVATIADFDNKLLEETKDYLKLKMTICAFAKSKNITVTSKEFDDFRINLMNGSSITSVDELLTYYTEADILFNCLLEKVQDWILTNAVEE